jgi:hypothetical protein
MLTGNFIRNTKKNPIKIRLSIKVGKMLIPLYLGISISHTKSVGILHKENFTRKIKENYLSKLAIGSTFKIPKTPFLASCDLLFVNR